MRSGGGEQGFQQWHRQMRQVDAQHHQQRGLTFFQTRGDSSQRPGIRDGIGDRFHLRDHRKRLLFTAGEQQLPRSQRPQFLQLVLPERSSLPSQKRFVPAHAA